MATTDVAGIDALVEAVLRSFNGAASTFDQPSSPAEPGADNRSQLVADLATSVLRRLDASEITTIDADALAQWCVWVLDRIEELTRSGQLGQVTFDRTSQGLDGRDHHASTLDVVTSDRPFLLSTIVDALRNLDVAARRQWHPIVGVELDDAGAITHIVPARDATHRFSLIHLELDRALDEPQIDTLTTQLHGSIFDVIRATEDFPAMRRRLAEVSTELRFGAWSRPADIVGGQPDEYSDDPSEAADLLDWMNDDNMVLLGVAELRGQVGQPLENVDGLGVLRDFGSIAHDDGDEVAPQTIAGSMSLPVGIQPAPLVVFQRIQTMATVQRRDHLQLLRLRIPPTDDEQPSDDDAVHELHVVGLFTRKGLADSVRTTPLIRRKLTAVLEREDIVRSSHDEGAITALIQALPKDELFGADLDTLHQLVVGLFRAEQRGEVRTMVRDDPKTPFVSVLVTVPRDRYDPALRHAIEQLLDQRFQPRRIDVDLSLGQRRETLARFLLQLDGPTPVFDLAALRSDIATIARTWLDDVTAALHAAEVPAAEHARLQAFAAALPTSYRQTTDPSLAVDDLLLLNRRLGAQQPLAVAVREAVDGTFPLRVAVGDTPLELSAFLPILESLGLTVLQEVPHRLVVRGLDGAGDQVHHLQDFTVRVASATAHLHGDDVGDRVEAAILATHIGHADIDRLNTLVLTAGMTWREVAILRAMRRLRRYLGTSYTPEYVNATIAGHPALARLLVDYFHARFDPHGDAPTEALARAAVTEACDALSRLDDDRILRGLLEVIDAVVRTNAYRDDATADDTGEPYLSFKYDPSRVAGVPQPVPYRETFVFGPSVEGVHLRFGPVARGGIRWSDRIDDVRNEIFDLVKAQLLKNAFIVPTGAKGGFVLRRPPEHPNERREEVRRQYVTFVRGLLDVADNLDGHNILAPPQVRRHDADDPYLVVAADRGTATLSDTANEVARRYGFWLDDAFASGGSHGYDHKALGVTAKGAWLSVRRHFRHLGIDVQRETVTVAGVGDMSGDVFGNGLLRSSAVALVAAFDHRDIFLDPEPDPQAALAERARLFALPSSSWQDYDRSVISAGGGVFPRTARRIELTDQMRAMLRVDAEFLTPPALIRAILAAPVDLLFAGGIGTYIKASHETTDQIADRANDELRVDASTVRARVIGEGANLFITQQGRIEYARRGGLINQDAIDNAAGVATSDVEVNLKILLREAEESGLLAADDRNGLLADLADEAVDLVMQAVDRQSAALAREHQRSAERLGAYDRMMTRLSRSHGFDRDVEQLPDSEGLSERAQAGAGLTRPELATLLAWAKRELKEHLLAGSLIDNPLFAGATGARFPATARQRFATVVDRHRLRRELVATTVANDLIDRMGITFITELADTAAVSLDDAVEAYQVARSALRIDDYWSLIDTMEVDHEPDRVAALAESLEDLVATLTAELVHHPGLRAQPETLTAKVSAVVAALNDGMERLGTDEQRHARTAYVRWLVDDLVDERLARFLGIARDVSLAAGVADVVDNLQADPADVADLFLRLGATLQIERLENLLERAPSDTTWAVRQKDGLRSELRRIRRDAAAITLTSDTDPMQAWQHGVEGLQRLIAGVDQQAVSLDAVAVCTRALREIIERGA